MSYIDDLPADEKKLTGDLQNLKNVYGIYNVSFFVEKEARKGQERNFDDSLASFIFESNTSGMHFR